MIALNPNTRLDTEAVPRPSGTPVTPEAWIAAQHWRYAVKQYDPSRKIDPETWDALEESLVSTPSGIGLQPWKFTVVDDPATRARLREVSYGQPQITDADRLVVFAYREGYSEADLDRYIARVSEVRGAPVESLAGLKAAAMSVVNRPKDPRDAWAARQAYIALGNFIASAAALGVDATPMEGIEPAKYDAILGLGAQGYRTLAVAAAGYRSTQDKYATLPKVRFRRSEVVEHV